MRPPTAPPPHAKDLGTARAEAFRLLARGVADRRSPFHTPTLASLDAAGAPTLRSVVLRGFDAATRTLRVHTDRRSAKAAGLAGDPRVALHGYDAQAQVQIRVAGRAALHAEGAVAESAWAASSPMSRRSYAVADAPGTAVPAPPPAPLDGAAGRANFLVLLIVFDRLDWLWLAAEGHRRACFSWTAEGLAESWLVP